MNQSPGLPPELTLPKMRALSRVADSRLTRWPGKAFSSMRWIRAVGDCSSKNALRAFAPTNCTPTGTRLPGW
ncbi:hypothetical protein G6F46_015205 [Rhizopus delemar]|nr:hypothetical protein G6F46_015205 [Rhizopus delemar]